jgi:hypothetical protein
MLGGRCFGRYRPRDHCAVSPVMNCHHRLRGLWNDIWDRNASSLCGWHRAATSARNEKVANRADLSSVTGDSIDLGHSWHDSRAACGRAGERRRRAFEGVTLYPPSSSCGTPWWIPPNLGFQRISCLFGSRLDANVFGNRISLGEPPLFFEV